VKGDLLGEISNDIERKCKGGGKLFPEKWRNGKGIVLNTIITKGNDLDNNKQCRK